MAGKCDVIRPGLLRRKIKRHVRAIIARQLTPYLKPGLTLFALLTIKGRVIGLYPTAESALALVTSQQRTVYRVITEPWYRGKIRVWLSYDLLIPKST